MSDLILNIRFGTKHFQITSWPFKIKVKQNDYWIFHPMDTWFKVYQLGNKHYR